jgi:hypothetical protein
MNHAFSRHATVLPLQYFYILSCQEVLGRVNRLLSFNTTKVAQETTRSAILLSLRVYSLPRELVYRATA